MSEKIAEWAALMRCHSNKPYNLANNRCQIPSAIVNLYFWKFKFTMSTTVTGLVMVMLYADVDNNGADVPLALKSSPSSSPWQADRSEYAQVQWYHLADPVINETYPSVCKWISCLSVRCHKSSGLPSHYRMDMHHVRPSTPHTDCRGGIVNEDINRSVKHGVESF